MKVIETKYFTDQLDNLKKRYRLINYDFFEFKKDIDSYISADLGKKIYKCRFKNSSIPCGKSGGFRIVVFIDKNVYIPLIIYSKTDKGNVKKIEIDDSLKAVFEELSLER